jgi:hypothetical protein
MMKNCSVHLYFLLMLLVSLPRLSEGQEKVHSPNPAPTIFFFVSGGYYSPRFDDLNAVYRTIERNYFLPAGSDFRNYYSLMAGILFKIAELHSMQAEIGTSLLKSHSSVSTNYLRMYYAGGTYLVNIPVSSLISLYVGPGADYIWLNSQRTYSNQIGVVEVNGDLIQLHGTVGVEFFLAEGLSIALEGGYSYATTLSPDREDLNFTLKSPTGGIKLAIPIVY